MMHTITDNYKNTLPQKVLKSCNALLVLNHWQRLQTKLNMHNDKSILFWNFFVKLLATFTSKSRKHNFREACLSFTTCSFPFLKQVVPKPFSTGNLESKTKSANWDRERKKSGQMKESKANSIAQILSPVDLVCLSAPYITKENWLRAKLLNIPSTK